METTSQSEMKVGVFSLSTGSELGELQTCIANYCAEQSYELVKYTNDTAHELNMIFSLGGDRELLAISPYVTDALIVPIRLGELGFLTEFDASEGFQDLISCLKTEKYQVIRRSRLIANDEFVALNEFVLASRDVGGVLSYYLNIPDGDYSFHDTADSLALCTPTGSTGWALSMGGAVIDLNADVIQIVPNNSIDHSLRTHVVNDSYTISVRLYTPATLICDNIRREGVEGLVTIKKHTPLLVTRPTLPRRSISDRLEEKIGYSRGSVSDKLPISGRWLYQIMAARTNGVTQKELVEITGISLRTIQSSLALMIKEGLVVRRPVAPLDDARKAMYFLANNNSLRVR